MMLPIIVGVIMAVIVGFFGYLAYCDMKTQKIAKEQAEEAAKSKK
jgi:uncharacterized protein YpmB